MASDRKSAGGCEPGRISRTRVEQDFLAGFETIGAPDFFEFLATHFRDDCILVCNSPATLLRLGGTHMGLENVMWAIRSFFTEFEVISTSVDDIVIDGAHVVANYSLSLRHLGTRRTGLVRGMNHYVLDADRKVSKLNVFWDNASLAVVGDLLESFSDAVRGMEQAQRLRFNDRN